MGQLCWFNYSGLGFWGGTTHATRDSLAKTPYFPETISCLALILGWTCCSGRKSSLDPRAHLGLLTGRPRTIGGKSRKRLRFSRSGLIIGDFTACLFQLSTFAHKDFAKVIAICFPGPLSVWVGFQARSFETGALSTCPAVFDPFGFS